MFALALGRGIVCLEVLFLMIASPVLAGGWVIAQNVCCRGDFFILEY